MKKQIISIVLAVSMLATMLTAFMLPAVADDGDESLNAFVTTKTIKVDGIIEEEYYNSLPVKSTYTHNKKNDELAFSIYMLATRDGVYVAANIVGEKTFVNAVGIDPNTQKKDYFQIYYNMSSEPGKTEAYGWVMLDYHNNTFSSKNSVYQTGMPEGFVSAATKNSDGNGWVAEFFLPWREGTKIYEGMKNGNLNCYFSIGFQYNDDFDGSGGYDHALYDFKKGLNYWSDYTKMSQVFFGMSCGVLSETNVFLDGDIAVDYDVTLGGVYDASNTYVKYTVTDAFGEQREYESYGVLVNPATDTYNYSLCLAPHRMGDTIKVELVSDGKVIGEKPEFSIKDYCLNMYNLSEEESNLTFNQYVAMKRLVVDMLNYGAIAQIFMDYDTDNLVNEGVEFEDLEEIEMRPISYEAIEVSESTKYGTEFTATNLYFDSSNRMCFKFKTDDIDNVIINIGDGTPGVAAKDLAYIDLGNGVYEAYTDIIDPADYDKIFTVRLVNINDKGTAYESREVVQTVKCSVNAYLGTTVDTYKADMLEDIQAYLYTVLAQTAYNYGHSMVLFAGA